MRPKKKILCVAENDELLSIRKFMLTVRGFHVYTASSAREAIELFCAKTVDLVLTDLHLSWIDGNELIVQLKNINAEVPMVLTSDEVPPGDRAHRADSFLGRGRCSPEEIFERVKVMSSRKRGPKKIVPKSIPADVFPSEGAA